MSRPAYTSADNTCSRSAPFLATDDLGMGWPWLGMLMPFQCSREARASEGVDRRALPALLVAESATASLRHEATASRLKVLSHRRRTDRVSTDPRGHGSSYTRRNLKLKRRISNCWFGLGVKSTYFCSP